MNGFNSAQKCNGNEYDRSFLGIGNTMNQARLAAYTTPRPDITAVVPGEAKTILDVGCSNGALGASLKAENPNRSVIGIEKNPELFAFALQKLDAAICADVDCLDWETQLPADSHSPRLIDPMYLEDMLRDVQPDRDNPDVSELSSYPGHRDLSCAKGAVTAMAHNLCADLDEFRAQAGHRPLDRVPA